MNKIIVIASIILIGFTACKKNTPIDPSTLPIANFSVLADSSNNILTLITNVPYSVVNNSANGYKYVWNFGNDSTSTIASPFLIYKKSGNYTISLTVQNKTEQKSTVARNVKVVNVVLKQIVVTNLFAADFPLTQSLNHSNIWTVLKLGANDSSYAFPVNNMISSFNAPIVYQSQVINNFDSTMVPYTFNMPTKILLNYPNLELWNFNSNGIKGIGYGLELYAQNNTGTFLISSSYLGLFSGGGFGLSAIKFSIPNNIFVLQSGDLEMVCDFEQ